jgi:prolyl oligopeptidase
MLRALSLRLVVLVAVVWSSTGLFGQDGGATVPPLPPPAKVVDVVTDYFGTKVSDPYRWMEAGPSDPAMMDFLKTQNTYARAMLDSIPGRDAMLARIHQLNNAVPAVRYWARGGTNLFSLQTAPGAKGASLLVRDASGKTRTLVDPVSFETGGQHAAIDYFAPSWDGKYVIAGVSLGGSENSTIHVVEAATGRMLPDAITRTQYGSPSWNTDSKSFYYSRLQMLPAGAPASAVYENERVYLHVLGTDSEKDEAIFGPGVASSPDIPKAGFVFLAITPGSNYKIAFYSAGTTDPVSMYIAPLAAKGTSVAWRKVVSAEDMVSPGADNAVTVYQSKVYLLSDKDASNRKLLVLDLDHPDMANAPVAVAASDAVLTGVYTASDGVYLVSKRGVTFTLQHAGYGATLNWSKVPVPYAGTISTIDANVLLPGVLYRLESWTSSDQAFGYDSTVNRSFNTGLIQRDTADFSGVEAREVEATSADGTKIPVSILCRKDVMLDGSHPTLYEGYGAYGISIDPYYDATVLAWIEKGGVFAFAHVRGGGEYGESWHNAGRKETKQHTIDDMVAAAQYLTGQKYTSAAHLGVLGTSAGGIAVGGALVQHPEMFAAAIDNVGMTDVLRFKGTQGGAANVPEFGDVDDPNGFKYLYGVSPYNHVVDGTAYPAVLGITGANDPRVPSFEVAKMIARLQAASSSKQPVLLRVDFDAGHGLGSSRPQRELLKADEFSFVLWQSGDPSFQPVKAAVKQ